MSQFETPTIEVSNAEFENVLYMYVYTALIQPLREAELYHLL